MRVNPNTMLFEDLTEGELELMLIWAKDIMLKGFIIDPHPPWVDLWFDTTGVSQSKKLSTILSVLVPRLLLSIIEETGEKPFSLRAQVQHKQRVVFFDGPWRHTIEQAIDALVEEVRSTGYTDYPISALRVKVRATSRTPGTDWILEGSERVYFTIRRGIDNYVTEQVRARGLKAH